MSSSRVRMGGLIPSGELQLFSSGPLRAGPDVSWLPRCRVGDNQGEDGACVIFALASWSEIMQVRAISDRECQAVYAQALKDAGRDGGGLLFQEGFLAAQKAGWLPGYARLRLVTDLAELVHQPLLVGHEMTAAWDRPNEAGCLDHTATGPSRGRHAEVVVGHGCLSGIAEGRPLVFLENSWGRGWGWKGLCVLTEDRFLEVAREMYKVVV